MTGKRKGMIEYLSTLELNFQRLSKTHATSSTLKPSYTRLKGNLCQLMLMLKNSILRFYRYSFLDEKLRKLSTSEIKNE